MQEGKTKISKDIKSDSFFDYKVGRAITIAIENSPLLLSQYWKNKFPLLEHQ